jgi:hypothetical protein
MLHREISLYGTHHCSTPSLAGFHLRVRGTLTYTNYLYLFEDFHASGARGYTDELYESCG